MDHTEKEDAVNARRITALGRAVAAAAVAAVVAALAATPVSADPPPAAAGMTSHGFLFKDGEFVTIDHPKATTVPATPNGQAGTLASGINDRGRILGAYEGRDRVFRNFLRRRRARFTRLAAPRPGPPGQLDEYSDINNRGHIVGFYNDEKGATTTSFLRTRKGRFVDIQVPASQVTGALKLNDRRQVVGIYVDADARSNPDGTVPPSAIHGFLWDDGDYETIDVPGAAATLATGINNRGQIVGSYIDAAGNYHGFRRSRKGAVRTLPEAPGAEPTAGGTQPAAINNRGEIAGLAYEADGGSRGFLLEDGEFTPIDGPDAVFTRPLDIDNRGRIVGDYGTKPPVGARGSARRAGLGSGLKVGMGGMTWRP
jgi:uncharacterized membrane protein